MAKDKPQMKFRESLGSCGSGEDATEPNTLLQKLRSTISKPLQNKVDSILQDVQKFSDIDKLYLYLQLPSGPSTGEKSSSFDLSSLSTADQMHACTWIRNHLEEHTDTCLPKQDVYDAYRRYCDNLCYRPLSAANFGKIIRDVFPNIKARRLGGRGQSKYCYSGIRRKTVVSMPPLPSLDLKIADTSDLTELVQCHNSEVMDAACALICDWAGKILKRTFDTVVEVAQFLIQQHIINPRSANAKLVTSVTISENSSPTYKVVKEQQSPRVGASDSGDNDSQNETDQGSRVTPPKQAEKKKTQESQKPVSSPRVEALVARLPLLLPRASPVKNIDAIGSSPPMLTTIGGSLKVAALPLAVGTTTSSIPISFPASSAGLVSQQAAVPVINMLLPNVQNNTLSFPVSEIPVTARSPGSDSVSPSSGKSSEIMESSAPALHSPNKGQKRVAESASVADENMAKRKRKRGRPKKMQAEMQQTPLSTVPLQIKTEDSDGADIQKGWAVSAGEPSDNTVTSDVIEITIGEDPLGGMCIYPSSQDVNIRAEQTVIKVAKGVDVSSLRPSSNRAAAQVVNASINSAVAPTALSASAANSEPVLGKVTEVWNVSVPSTQTSDLAPLETAGVIVTSLPKEDGSDIICIDDHEAEIPDREVPQKRIEDASNNVTSTRKVPFESTAGLISKAMVSSRVVDVQEGERGEKPEPKDGSVTEQRVSNTEMVAHAGIKLNESTSVLDHQTLTAVQLGKYSTILLAPLGSQVPATRPSCISSPKISKVFSTSHSDICPKASAAMVEVTQSEPHTCLSKVATDSGEPFTEPQNVQTGSIRSNHENTANGNSIASQGVENMTATQTTSAPDSTS